MEFLCDYKYIVFPASFNAEKKRVMFSIDGKLVYDLVMALDSINPDYFFPVNVERFIGLNLNIDCDDNSDISFEKTDFPIFDYCGEFRPMVHFTSKRGWINDPNGLLYYGGKYFMFYQHNPVATTWENMHWGLATSKDLLHWEERGDVIFPDENGTIFSGSGIVDIRNVSGLKQGEEAPLLFFYTSAGNTSETSKGKKFNQRLAYSLDGGNTFIKYPQPIVEHIVAENRDPKVVYFEPDNSYIMMLFLDQHEFALLKSFDLLHWNEIQRIEMQEDAECPDFYELAIDGDSSHKKWVLSAASDWYYIGAFDGYSFNPETELLQLNYGDISYAAQSWSNEPSGRRIRTAFMNRVIPGESFGCCMDFPQEMKLRYINGTLKLCANPIAEISKLYKNSKSINSNKLDSNSKIHLNVETKACVIWLSMKCEDDFSLCLYGLRIDYEYKRGTLSCNQCSAPIEGCNGEIQMTILFDSIGVEIFADEGSVFMGIAYLQNSLLNQLVIESKNAVINKLEVHELISAYEMA